MPDYIHRKTVLDTIRRNAMLRVQDIYDAVESLPVVNVGNGKWIPHSRRYAKWNLDGSCSSCGTFSLSTYGNFCCYCGAEMKEDKVPESDTPLNNVED